MKKLLERAARNFEAALVRAIRTGVQTAVGAVGVAQLTSIDWRAAAGTAVTAAVLSLVSGLASELPETKEPQS